MNILDSLYPCGILRIYLHKLMVQITYNILAPVTPDNLNINFKLQSIIDGMNPEGQPLNYSNALFRGCNGQLSSFGADITKHHPYVADDIKLKLGIISGGILTYPAKALDGIDKEYLSPAVEMLNLLDDKQEIKPEKYQILTTAQVAALGIGLCLPAFDPEQRHDSINLLIDAWTRLDLMEPYSLQKYLNNTADSTGFAETRATRGLPSLEETLLSVVSIYPTETLSVLDEMTRPEVNHNKYEYLVGLANRLREIFPEN